MLSPPYIVRRLTEQLPTTCRLCICKRPSDYLYHHGCKTLRNASNGKPIVTAPCFHCVLEVCAKDKGSSMQQHVHSRSGRQELMDDGVLCRLGRWDKLRAVSILPPGIDKGRLWRHCSAAQLGTCVVGTIALSHYRTIRLSD